LGHRKNCRKYRQQLLGIYLGKCGYNAVVVYRMGMMVAIAAGLVPAIAARAFQRRLQSRDMLHMVLMLAAMRLDDVPGDTHGHPEG
jgi:uncharacterized integral membrane protein